MARAWSLTCSFIKVTSFCFVEQDTVSNCGVIEKLNINVGIVSFSTAWRNIQVWLLVETSGEMWIQKGYKWHILECPCGLFALRWALVFEDFLVDRDSYFSRKLKRLLQYMMAYSSAQMMHDHSCQKRCTVFTDFWEETKRRCIVKMQETSLRWQQYYVPDVFLKTPKEESTLCTSSLKHGSLHKKSSSFGEIDTFWWFWFPEALVTLDQGSGTRRSPFPALI